MYEKHELEKRLEALERVVAIRHWDVKEDAQALDVVEEPWLVISRMSDTLTLYLEPKMEEEREQWRKSREAPYSSPSR